jgi:hypothetical protein
MELMPSLDQVEGGAHDAVSVDSVMSVDGVEVAGLPELAQSQRFTGDPVDGR